MELIFGPELLFSFLTLSLLEIVLGIDNLIFIALVVQHLPPHFRKKARVIGLTLALVMRILMLLGIAWIMQLTHPLFTLFGQDISIKDMLLLGGGVFLIAKSTLEMHADVTGELQEERQIKAKTSFLPAVIQIILIDIVFSFDSIITAVGMTSQIPVIVAAMVVAMLAMLLAAPSISKFLDEYPALKVLALSFILMIGMVLVAEGMHFHIPRGYVYSSLLFALFIESVNIAAGNRRQKKGEKKA